MGRHTNADICHNVCDITITSKNHNANWSWASDPETWSHNGWVFSEEGAMAGDNGRLYCDVLQKGEMKVKILQQDSDWQNCLVLCSDKAGSTMSFLTDWAADIESSEFRLIDAVWQTI